MCFLLVFFDLHYPQKSTFNHFQLFKPGLPPKANITTPLKLLNFSLKQALTLTPKMTTAQKYMHYNAIIKILQIIITTS